MTNKFKPALTFREQLELMKSKGLMVKDDEFAEKVLSRVNYYKLSGYSLHLKGGDKFVSGTRFEDIYDIYLFNKKLSLLIVDLLESIEVHFKSTFANVLARRYGAEAHTMNVIYSNQAYYNSFLKLYAREKNSHSNVRFIQHNIKKYGELPIWVAIEVLSFGLISKLYRNLLDSKVKKEISDVFLSHNNISVTPYYLQNWLQVTGALRNRCAHYSRLYNRTIPVTANLFKTYKCSGRKLDTSKIDRDTLFAALLVIKRMVGKEEQWADIVIRLEKLLNEYAHVIELNKLGFPNNWNEYLKPQSPETYKP